MVSKQATLEEKLFTLGFRPDEESHLHIKDPELCTQCEGHPCTTLCPVEAYKLEGDDITVSFEGCLECGSCRIGCPHDNIEWRYPRGGFGVTYKQG